jgi:trehalose/maltose hydrolase-like predicted phosphorylase
MAGLFDSLPSIVGDKTIMNEDLVCCPNWGYVTFRLEGEKDWFDFKNLEMVKYKRGLNMYTGSCFRDITVKDSKNR